jgi:sulfotransferase
VRHNLNLDVDFIEKMERPRLFKTHLPVQFMPPKVYEVKPKIIHIQREVKDVAVSCYHLRRNIGHEDIPNIEQHFDQFLNDRVLVAPYREHILNWINLPDYDNILYLTYEEQVSDMSGTIRKVAGFLGKELSDGQVEELKDHLSFDKMKSMDYDTNIIILMLISQI